MLPKVRSEQSVGFSDHTVLAPVVARYQGGAEHRLAVLVEVEPRLT